LTENYAALEILKQSNQTLYTADMKQETMEPFVLFGSSFPKDRDYTQVGTHTFTYIIGVPEQVLE
jgi:hypothetical protein